MRPSADRLHENEKNILVDNVSRSYIKYDRFNYTQSEGHQIKQDDIFQINCRDLSIEDVFIFQLASIKRVRSDTVVPTADGDTIRPRDKTYTFESLIYGERVIPAQQLILKNLESLGVDLRATDNLSKSTSPNAAQENQPPSN